MSFKYQRKSIRFAKSKTPKFTTSATVGTKFLHAALDDSRTSITATENMPTTKTAFTSALTTAAWNASAVTELGKMYQVAMRCTRCLSDNGLSETP